MMVNSDDLEESMKSSANPEHSMYFIVHYGREHESPRRRNAVHTCIEASIPNYGSLHSILRDMIKCALPFDDGGSVSLAQYLHVHFLLVMTNETADSIGNDLGWDFQLYHRYFDKILSSSSTIKTTSRFHVVPYVSLTLPPPSVGDDGQAEYYQVPLSQARQLLNLNEYSLHNNVISSALDTVLNYVVIHTAKNVTLMQSSSPVPYNQAIVPGWGGLMVTDKRDDNLAFRIFGAQLRKALDVPRSPCEGDAVGSDITEWEAALWNEKRSRTFYSMLTTDVDVTCR